MSGTLVCIMMGNDIDRPEHTAGHIQYGMV